MSGCDFPEVHEGRWIDSGGICRVCDGHECAHCHRPSGALWLCPDHVRIGTCAECGREAQYREAVTGYCRECFACEWPTDKPDPAGTYRDLSTDGGMSSEQ